MSWAVTTVLYTKALQKNYGLEIFLSHKCMKVHEPHAGLWQAYTSLRVGAVPVGWYVQLFLRLGMAIHPHKSWVSERHKDDNDGK